MPCVLDIFLKISFQMLVAFEIFEQVILPVVCGKMIMHEESLSCQVPQYPVFLQSRGILRFMCFVKGSLLIPVKPETASGCIYEDHCIIPVEDPLFQDELPDLLFKSRQHPRCLFLDLPDKAQAWDCTVCHEPLHKLPCAPGADKANVQKRKEHCFHVWPVLIGFFQPERDL